MEIRIGQAIRHVWYLKGLDGLCLVEVAQSLNAYLFSRNEQCLDVVGCLGICDHGAVAVAGRVYVAGGTWGEDMIVNWPELHSEHIAIALTGAEVLALNKPNLFRILSAYPAAEKKVRKAALQIATRRAMKIVSQSNRNDKSQDALTQRVKDAFDSSKTVTHAMNPMYSSSQIRRASKSQSASVSFGPHENTKRLLWAELQGIKETCSQGLADLQKALSSRPKDPGGKRPPYVNNQESKSDHEGYQPPPWPNGTSISNGHQGMQVVEIAQKITELSEQLYKLAPGYSRTLHDQIREDHRRLTTVPLPHPIVPQAANEPGEGCRELLHTDITDRKSVV